MDGRPRSILMTADTVGGVWIYALDLCRQLATRGVDIHLATLGGYPSATQLAQVERLPQVKLYPSDYKLEWMDDPWESVERSDRWLRGLAAELRPDLIHFNHFAQTDTADYGAPVVTVFHSCVYSWWRAVLGEDPPPTKWRRYYGRVREALHRSRMVVAPTRAILREAEAIYGPLFGSQCIYNGRRTLVGPVTESSHPLIFSSGRIWDKAKNLAVLSEIALHIDWPIYVAGNPRDPSTGEEVGLEGVHTLGQLPPTAVSEWMGRAGIYLSPTLYEPFGLSILEAAQAGCALVLSDLPTLRELWGPAALYVNPRSVTDVAEAVNRLTSDEPLRQRITSASRERAQRYTAADMGAAYYRLYTELLRQPVTPLTPENSRL